MISFDNTEIAFKGKSNKDLKRAHQLFGLIANPKLVKIGGKLTNLALKLHLPIKGIIKKTIFKQFCGGETISECNKTIHSLGQYGVGTILDYSIEGIEGEAFFDATAKEIIKTIEKAHGNKNIPFAVFKITGIARFKLLEKCNDITYIISNEEQKEYNKVVARVDEICKVAHDLNVPIFIDAEDFCIQDTIDRLATLMIKKYNTEKAIVYNTIQLYRHDRLVYLKSELEKAKQEKYKYAVKLVRGAYMEKERARAKENKYPSPIQKDKKASDHDYNAALQYCVENISNCSICAGTHNEESSHYLVYLMEQNNLEKSNPSIYFAQLLGMSDHISFNLADAGYNVAKYVPYGPINDVMPYLMRRAEENTSVAGQTGRELNLIQKEIKRRKTKA